MHQGAAVLTHSPCLCLCLLAKYAGQSQEMRQMCQQATVNILCSLSPFLFSQKAKAKGFLSAQFCSVEHCKAITSKVYCISQQSFTSKSMKNLSLKGYGKITELRGSPHAGNSLVGYSCLLPAMTQGLSVCFDSPALPCFAKAEKSLLLQTFQVSILFK